MRARREKRPSVRKTETQASLEQRSAKPKRDANDAATKEMLCCLTLELSGRCTAAFRLNDWLGLCGQSLPWRTAPCLAKQTSRKPHALKLDDLPKNQRIAFRSEARHVNDCRTKNELPNSATSKDLTLELSGGEAVRLE
jgi:hypothetical protein